MEKAALEEGEVEGRDGGSKRGWRQGWRRGRMIAGMLLLLLPPPLLLRLLKSFPKAQRVKFHPQCLRRTDGVRRTGCSRERSAPEGQ